MLRELALNAFIAVRCIKAGSMSLPSLIQCLCSASRMAMKGYCWYLSTRIPCVYPPLPPSVISIPNAVRIWNFRNGMPYNLNHTRRILYMHSLKMSGCHQLRNCTYLNYKWCKITAYAATQKICFLPLGLSDDSPTGIHEKNPPPEAAGSRTLCIAEWAGLIQELPRSAVPEMCHSVSPPPPRQASVVDRVPSVLAETTQ